MTPDTVELRRLLEKVASPLPWTLDEGDELRIWRGADHELAAAAVNALPALLALLDRLEAAEANANSAFCVYCGCVGPKRDDAMIDHVMSCEKRPWRAAVVERDQLLGRLEALEGRLKRLRDVLEWSQTQCPGKCAGVLHDALNQDSRLAEES